MQIGVIKFILFLIKSYLIEMTIACFYLGLVLLPDSYLWGVGIYLCGLLYVPINIAYIGMLKLVLQIIGVKKTFTGANVAFVYSTWLIIFLFIGYLPDIIKFCFNVEGNVSLKRFVSYYETQCDSNYLHMYLSYGVLSIIVLFCLYYKNSSPKTPGMYRKDIPSTATTKFFAIIVVLLTCFRLGYLCGNAVTAQNSSSLYLDFMYLGENIEPISVDDLEDSCLVRNSHPNNGVVSTAEMAYTIADCVFSNIYGRSTMDKEKPYRITLLEDRYWVIEGTMNTSEGGTAHLMIKKENGQIVEISHGK